MIDAENRARLRDEIAACMRVDRGLLERLRSEVRPLRPMVRHIRPRATSAVSLVGTDGGNITLQFDPFMVQLVRIVDSSNNAYALEVITSTTNVERLSAAQFDLQGCPCGALGRMMAYLGVRQLSELSPLIKHDDDDETIRPHWVRVYRELIEWATLFDILRGKDFGSDTLIVHDGLLRSKIFAQGLFTRILDGITEAIEQRKRTTGRCLYLVGVAKHSKVLDRYRLAMVLEGILTADYAAAVEVARDLENWVYENTEYARGMGDTVNSGLNGTIGGKMYFVKFGGRRDDPVWPVDIFLPQVEQAQAVLGYLLTDAVDGFPIPFYPQCLQRAHENAALVDFDHEIVQDLVLDGIRGALGGEAFALNAFLLRDSDPAQGRYWAAGA